MSLALQPSVGWGHPANFGPEWFKTFEQARIHILDLAAYIFEEELRIAAA